MFMKRGIYFEIVKYNITPLFDDLLVSDIKNQY